ncbi:MAG: hypothetical protein ACWA42_01120 [Lutibacter sp.]
MKKLLLVIGLFMAQIGYSQCAMCRAVVESGGGKQAEGLNSGIIYLMAFPYLLAGVLIFFIIKKIRRQKL